MFATRFSAFCAICVLGASPALAQDTTGQPIVTEHQISIVGKTLKYHARAGFIPVRASDTGETHANLFYIAYTLDRAASAPARPLIFLWNGGPGSNSGLVHLLGFGPKRIAIARGNAPPYSSQGTTLVDNSETLLTYGDLVFIDPAGTGYSRPTKPEYASEFYQSLGDAESVAEFIKTYRADNGAAASPVFILGESYGVTRASLVAEALERRGIHANGAVLLSGGFPLPNTGAATTRNALGLPTFTAAAYANKKLPPDLQRLKIDSALSLAKSYAEGPYATALAKGDSLSPADREAVTAALARFTGLPAAQINRLRVSSDQVSNTLLADTKMMIGHYDSRDIGPRDTTQTMYDPTTDPSLRDILDAASVIHYFRSELGIKSDMYYQGPFGGGYPPPTSFRGDWMSVRWGRGGAQGAGGNTGRGGGRGTGPSANSTSQGLAAAMAANPKLHVFMGCGYYDLGGACYSSEYSAKNVAPELAPRVTARVYAGGHAIYTDDAARKALSSDIGKFIQASIEK